MVDNFINVVDILKLYMYFDYFLGGEFMKVKGIENFLISIPLSKPKKISTRSIASREYLITKITTDNGFVGWGFTFGTMTEYAGAEYVLKELVIGQDVFCTEKIWDIMYKATVRWGRRGAILRAMSAIDIALWDIKAQMTGVPLYKLLGGYKNKVKVYKSSGYYSDLKAEADLDYIQQDCFEALKEGFTAYKLRVGLDPLHDIKRVETARKTLGYNIDIFVDANNAWDTWTSLKFGKLLEKYDIGWFEEPVAPDDIASLSRISKELSIPIAVGELESTHWAFQSIIDSKAAKILQPDVTVIGGVTEFLKVAHQALAQGITVVPHAYSELHIHLACALPQIDIIEYFEPNSDIVNINKILNNSSIAENGYLMCADEPGLGFKVDESKIDFYKITQ